MARIVDIFARLLADDAGFEADVIRKAQKAGDAAGLTMGQRLAGGISRSSTAIGQSLASIGRGLSTTGRSMTTNLTLPILAAGGAAAKLALDFDTAGRQLVGLTDVTAGELDGIKEKILALGPAVGKGPQELIEAFYFIASAGFDAAEAMDVLEVAAESSASGLGDTQTVAQVLGGVINAYGKENITAARAADILTEAVSQGTAEAAGFASVIGNVVPGAAALGVSFDQVTAAMAGMTLTGVGVEESATSLIQIFSSLQKPTVQAEAALKDMGLSSAELRRQLREEGLLATLRTLESRFAGNETAAAAVFGNIRALRGVTALLTLDSDQLNEVFAKVEDSLGRQQTAYEETEGPQRDLDRAMADLAATGIQLGEDVLPVVVDVAQEVAAAARELGKWWRSLDDDTKKQIVQWALWIAVAGPALLLLGKLASAAGILFKGIGFLAGAKGIPALIGLLGKLRLASFAALGPIGLLVAATLILKEASEAVQNWIGGVSDSTKDLADQVGMNAAVVNDGLNYLVDQLGISFDEAERRVRDYIDRTGASYIDAMKAVLDGTDQVTQAGIVMNEAWAASWRGMAAITDLGGAAVVEEIEEVPAGVAAVLEDGEFVVGPAAEAMVDPIDEAMQKAIEDTAKSAEAIIDALADELAEAPADIQEELDALREALQDPYTDTRRLIDLEAALAATDWAEGLAAEDSRLAADTATRLEGLLAQYELLAPGALAAGELVNPALEAGIDSNLAALTAYIQQTAVPGITDPLQLAAVLNEMGYDSLAGYIRGVVAQKQAARDAAHGVALQTAKGLIFNAYDEGYAGGKTWTKGIADGIAHTAYLVSDKIQNILNELTFAGSPPFTRSRKAGEGVGTSYMTALLRQIASAIPALGGMLGGILTPGLSPAYAGMGVPSYAPAGLPASLASAPAPVAGKRPITVNVLDGGVARSVDDIGRGLRELESVGLLPDD